MLGRDIPALLPRGFIVEDHLFPDRLVRLHDAMCLADLLETEDSRRLRFQPAPGHVLGDLPQRGVESGNPGVPKTKRPKKVR
jgi:hypothetical protein